MNNIYKISFYLHFIDDGETLFYEDTRRAATAGAAKELTRDLYTDSLVKVEVLQVTPIFENGKFVK